ISTAEDKIMAATKSIMEKQKIEDNRLNKKIEGLEDELELAAEAGIVSGLEVEAAQERLDELTGNN
ncbi:MAG: hypothetical protein VW713_10455, partial [Alphaproteobacteria bacterium]